MSSLTTDDREGAAPYRGFGIIRDRFTMGGHNISSIICIYILCRVEKEVVSCA